MTTDKWGVGDKADAEPVHGSQPYALTGETEVTITLNIRDEQKYAEYLKQLSYSSVFERAAQ